MCKQKPPVVVVRDTKRIVNQSSESADIRVVGSRACDMADEYIQGKQAKSDQCLLKSPIVRSFEYPKQSRYHQKQAYDNSDVNMDMIGRLDEAKGLIISGWGTSPVWGKIIPEQAAKQNIRYTVDSSGVGASDHTSFYLKNIPVVQFFTGSHGDYHKTSDDTDKINLAGEAKILTLIAGVLEKTDQETTEPEFFSAGNPHSGQTTSNFKVTLGVMPDYSYSGKGLKIDGVSKARPAEAAGIQAGDVILKLAGKDIATIYDYMEILGEHEKGQTVEAEFLRGKDKKTVKITF